MITLSRLLGRRCYSRLFSHSITSSSTFSLARSHDLASEILVEGNSHSRTAILNRPSSLNALTTVMSARLKKLYESWEENPDIGFVMLKGCEGRAFCAGGDVVAICELLNQGREEDCKEFFRTLYNHIYVLGTFLKPHVSILNGITMGGGAGISVPGTFRMATDKTTFATPEIHIGFHPDAGASFYLSHLPGYMGEYLALTGEKIDGAEMVASGLATHYCLNARLGWLEDRLGKLVTDDPSVLESNLSQYGDLVYPHKSSIFFRIEAIDRCFGQETVEEIVNAVECEAAKSSDEWAVCALRKLKEASPLWLNVTLKSIRDGRYQSLDQCLVREYRISLRGISGYVSSDFCEGVRARLVDKDFAPKWDPPSLNHVTRDMIDSFFAPLGEFEPELKLPTVLREAFL